MDDKQKLIKAAKKKERVPYKPLSGEAIAKLSQSGLPIVEIATIFGVNRELISLKYKDWVEKGKVDLKQSLREKQISVAMEGNPTMLIWLGKQILDQKDERSQEIKVKDVTDGKSEKELRKEAEELASKIMGVTPEMAAALKASSTVKEQK